MPGYLKIGCTSRNIIDRVKELDKSTSVPEPFKIEAYFISKNQFSDELEIHRLFDEYRVPNKEFFKITLNENQRIPSNFLEEFVNHLSAYVEKNIPHKDIDYKIFVFSILSFIYLLILDYGGAFPDRDKAIETFIDNTVKFF